MEQLSMARVINGTYTGRIGKATDVNKYGNVAFYPVEDCHPYCVCLKATDIEYIKDAKEKTQYDGYSDDTDEYDASGNDINDKADMM